MRCTVTMKLSPVRIEEKPAMKMPSAVAITPGVGVRSAVRRVEGPAGIDAAGEHGEQTEQSPPTTSRYQLSRLSLGKARSRAPIMIGRKKLPSVAGIDGIRKKKTITTPCMVKSLL